MRSRLPNPRPPQNKSLPWTLVFQPMLASPLAESSPTSSSPTSPAVPAAVLTATQLTSPASRAPESPVSVSASPVAVTASLISAPRVTPTRVTSTPRRDLHITPEPSGSTARRGTLDLETDEEDEEEENFDPELFTSLHPLSGLAQRVPTTQEMEALGGGREVSYTAL